MGQSLGCYLAGISSRFVWLSSFCYYAFLVGQWSGCYLVGIISRFPCLNVRQFLELLFLCWLRRSVIGLLLGWQFLSPNFPIDYHISNLYQTFNFTVQTRAAVSLVSRSVLTNFYFLLLLLHSFKSVQQFFAFQLSRELCFFLWGFSHSCVACGGFLSPHFLFSRLIGLHISMCCDSVSFDFIKPATTVARFIQHSCLFIF